MRQRSLKEGKDKEPKSKRTKESKRNLAKKGKEKERGGGGGGIPRSRRSFVRVSCFQRPQLGLLTLLSGMLAVVLTDALLLLPDLLNCIGKRNVCEDAG